MHFETLIQVYKQLDVISTTVQTRNDEKKYLDKILTTTNFYFEFFKIISCLYCCTYNILLNDTISITVRTRNDEKKIPKKNLSVFFRSYCCTNEYNIMYL